MRKDWDNRAQDNALFWVMSKKDAWNKEEYYESGREDIEKYVLPYFAKHGITREIYGRYTVLDIGCGTGRLVRALAAQCGRVMGIDISEEMIRRAKEDNAHLTNVEWVVGDGKGLQPCADGSVDFCFSFIVLQHIPSKRVITSYFREIYRVLKPGGRAKFQLRGTPGNPPGKVLWYRGFGTFYVAFTLWRNILPLPWLRRYGTVYGACFTKREVQKALEAVGFTEVSTYHETDRYLWAEVCKPL